jgi:hypothetical protein
MTRRIGAIDDSEVLGPVGARFNDYIGTAVADDAYALLHSKSISQLAGLDREHWAIVGFELFHTSGQDCLVIYATDRQVLAICDRNPTAPLPVVAFEVPDSDSTRTFIEGAFQEIRVRLTAKRMSAHSLRVIERRPLTAGQTPTSGRDGDPSTDLILLPQQ